MRRLGQVGTSSPHSSLALRRQAAARERNPHRRSLDKLKARTLPTLNSVATERSVEQVMVHTLQMELEGTRDTVIGLERRLDDLHEDLSSISRNVSNLLRMVSQSPCPSMYMSNVSLLPGHLQNNMAASGHLHQGFSYNNMAASCSPSPNPSSMYQTPTFYFSESTDGENSGGLGGGGLADANGHMTDVRDNVSLFSGSNCSPMPPPDIGNFHNESGPLGNRNRLGENFLSPFQSGHLLKSNVGGSRGSMTGIGGGGGFSTPSPLHSPRVNFTPSPMSNYFPSFPKTPASPSLSRTLADRGGPPPSSSGSDMPSKGTLGRLHSPTKHQPLTRRAQTPDPLSSSASPATSQTSAQTKDSVTSSTPERVKPSTSFPSPKPGRSQSPRPSNLSPLQSRFPKASQRRFTRASYPGGSSTAAGITMSPLALEINFPSPVSTLASCTSDSNPSPAKGKDSPYGSPLLGNTARAQEFQGEYYTLTQLEPCDGNGSKVCEKGSALRKSEQDLARSPLSRSVASLQDNILGQTPGENQHLSSADHNLSSHTLRNDRISREGSGDPMVESQGSDQLAPPSPKSDRSSIATHNSPTQRHQHPQKHQPSSLSKTPSPSSSPSNLRQLTTVRNSPSNEARPNKSPVLQPPVVSSLMSTSSSPATKAKRPQSLSPSSIRMQNSPQSGSSSCSPQSLDFIDSSQSNKSSATAAPQPLGGSGQFSQRLGFPRQQGRQGPVASAQQMNRFYGRSASEDVKTSSNSGQAGDSLMRSKSSGAEATTGAGNAPLSQAESASDLDDGSPTS
ncbi:hypothetical protein ElyMa_005109700 [Elysia marginata]|uniref:Uncharacterized protein n=1 Tax=Elysia marginata TaxID=1093978 RepID=A0AAV4JI78_9GAST|nr:hypothetical protein ElyMa_005109700 [Elysia marginata]